MSNKKRLGLIESGMRYYKIMILLTVALVGIGIYALVHMPKQEFPPITVRQGLIVGVYPGATAEEVEEQVAKPLEKFLFTYEEINKKKTYTMSQDGVCYTMVELKDNVYDKDRVWSKIKLGVNNTLKPSLTPGVLAVVVNDNFGETSALLITLQSKEKTYRELQDYLDILEGKLRRIESVSNLRRYGLQSERIGIYIDKQKLNSYNISYLQVMQALQLQGLTTMSGTIEGSTENLPIHVTGGMDTEQRIAEQVILAIPGQPTVRLKDIATIRREYAKPDSYIQNNDMPCILLSLEMVAGYNIVHYGEQVDKVLTEFRKDLPASVHIERIADSPKVVNDSVTSFVGDLFTSIGVVILVLMLLFPFRSAIVSATSIPISIFVSIAVMYFSGIPLNTVTLAGLIVVLGMIVDNSIIVIDAYLVNLDKGMSRWHAAIYSAKEYLWGIFLATACICSIFYPLLLTMKGMFHDFLEDFPNTLTISLMTSLVVATLIIPFMEYMLIRKGLVKRQQERLEKNGGVEKKTVLNYVNDWYVWLLTRCFRAPKLSLAIGVAIVALGGWLLTTIPVRMFPFADRDQFAVEIYLPQGSTLDETAQICDSLSSILHQDKRVKSVTKFVGCSSPRFQTTYAPNIPNKHYAQFIVNTTSIEDNQALLEEYTDKYANYFPNAYVRFKELDYQKIALPIEVRYYGDNIDSLMRCANTLVDHMRQMPELTWVHTNYEEMRPTVEVKIDPVKSARLGLNKTLAELQIAAIQEGISAGTMWEKDYPLDIHVEQEKTGPETVNELEDSYLATAIPTVRIPLRQVATITPSWSQGQIVRRNGVRSISVLANVKYHVNQGSAFNDVLKLHKKYVAPTMPHGVNMEVGGCIENDAEVTTPIIQGMSIAVLIIFIMLLINFKKLSLAAGALSSILLCILGAAVGLKIFGLEFGMTSILGIISLMGCIVRNAILIFEHAEEKRLVHKWTAKDAAFDAGKRRMLPIFLTSATTGVGVVPMIISHTALWMPMGAVICFGTIISMVLSVTLLPLIYCLLFQNVQTNTDKETQVVEA
ncbi:MAG TPA: efflux RND transporter permease subunit [Bacteroidaceae bacterium]|nr:efflux RND transporter permease subunit [Bacteroidaceae bacterium]